MRAAAQKAEKARAAAQKAAKAAKEAAQRTAEAVKELVREAAAAIKSLISAIASLGGWAVLIIVLIVVIIAAVIAASPFGIFLSDDAASSAPSGIPVSSVLTECRSELTDKIESIEASVDEYDRVEAVGHLPEWNDVLAVFAVKTVNPDDENAMDVVEIDADKKQILKNVFWDMTTIDYSTAIVNTGGADKTVLLIEIHAQTAEEMIGVYHFSAKQREMIDELKEQGDAFGAVTKSMTVSDPQAASVMRELPDTLPEERKRVMKYTLALVGKVNYFWGGKSTVRGWDDTWGTLKTVSADGSSTTGTLRPYGLDCSGFVTWVYVNAGFSVSQIGDGVRGQSAKCTRISWDEAKPGDLAFYNDLSHVGIIAGKDSAGNILVVHCNASADTVSVTGKDGFGFAGRVRGMEG